MGRWGEGWSFRSHMAQNKQIKHKTWWGGELWLFQPPKVHAAQDEAKNGRSGSILAWMMDDGWWGGCQRNDKSDNNKRKANENGKQPQQQNKESKISPHPTLPGPKGKQKEDKNERKEKHKPSSWVQIDTEERCSYVHHTRKKEKKPNIMSYNCSYDWKRRGRWGRGMRIWISVSTWWDVRYVCVSVCMLPLYEGRVPCSLSKSFLLFTWLYFHFSFFWEYLGLRF